MVFTNLQIRWDIMAIVCAPAIVNIVVVVVVMVTIYNGWSAFNRRHTKEKKTKRTQAIEVNSPCRLLHLDRVGTGIDSIDREIALRVVL